MLQADRTVATTCPYCGVGCQIDLHVRKDVVYRVAGRFDSPVNRGQLCVKGRFGYDFIDAPDRLRQPMLRAARYGPLAPASWETALGQVASRMQAIRRESGPDSLAFLASAKCTNEENYLVQKLARAVLGTNNVDHCARL
jgi:predicted molibdopterin-dependent oxidoreductase YjgC